jgi:hypothetical protein
MKGLIERPSTESPQGRPAGLGHGFGMDGATSGTGSGVKVVLASNKESMSGISLTRYLVASFSRYFTSRRLILLAIALKANSSSKLPGALSGILGWSEQIQHCEAVSLTPAEPLQDLQVED